MFTKNQVHFEELIKVDVKQSNRKRTFSRNQSKFSASTSILKIIKELDTIISDLQFLLYEFFTINGKPVSVDKTECLTRLTLNRLTLTALPTNLTNNLLEIKPTQNESNSLFYLFIILMLSVFAVFITLFYMNLSSQEKQNELKVTNQIYYLI